MLASDEASLRDFLARVLGYERTDAIEQALRTIRLSAAHAAALLLLGDVEADLDAVARGIHRRALGADRPFVTCNRRMARRGSTAVAAAEAARGGSLYVHRDQRPRDYSAAVALLRDPSAPVQLIVCAGPKLDSDPVATLPIPIVVPSIETRSRELPRIVEGYLLDASAAQGLELISDEDRDCVLAHDAESLATIEEAALRLAMIRQAGTITGAARRMGITHSALSRWLHRRTPTRPSGSPP
jgi:hypothetical protein